MSKAEKDKLRLIEDEKKMIRDGRALAKLGKVDPKPEVKEEYERVKRLKVEKENLRVIWKEGVDKDDYKAAKDYLDLVITDKRVLKSIIKKLRKAKLVTKKAKDILRASRLSKLGMDSIHVQHNINKYKMGIKLSPVLLVCYKDVLIIADGYHRVCASYELSEELNVPCKLISI